MATPAMNQDATVFIVDDDDAVRESLAFLMKSVGLKAESFPSAQAFLDSYNPNRPGCLVLDIRMPGMSGLELQQELQRRACQLPVIIITGHGDVASAREAFRAHALDFLEKPLDEARLFAAIAEAYAQQSADRQQQSARDEFDQRLQALTPREREVMELVIIGHHNRKIAELLGISVRTVEVHKARMMSKLQVDGIPQLVRISLEASARGNN